MTLTNAQKITEFHVAIDGGENLLQQPTVPSEKKVALRRTLLREEYAEVVEAFDLLSAAPSPEEKREAMTALMHELADLLYVTYGAFCEFGVDADPVFGELHRANMQKANGPRRDDGKVMKPADFVPANIARVLAEQTASGEW